MGSWRKSSGLNMAVFIKHNYLLPPTTLIYEFVKSLLETTQKKMQESLMNVTSAKDDDDNEYWSLLLTQCVVCGAGLFSAPPTQCSTARVEVEGKNQSDIGILFTPVSFHMDRGLPTPYTYGMDKQVI